MKPYLHVVSVSGGKDSTATYLLARGGRQYDMLLADVGTACNTWGACE